MFFMMFSMYGLFGLLIAAACAMPIWRAVRLPRSVPRVPACARCRYVVEGLEGLRCPECGADLRSVGITTPRMIARHRGSMAGALVAWTILVFVVGFIGSSIAMSYWAMRSFSAAGAGGTTMTTTLTPKSGAFASADIIVDTGAMFGGSGTPTTIELTLSDGTAAEFVVDSMTGEVRYTDASGAETIVSGTYALEQVVDWFVALGLDVDGAPSSDARDMGRLMDLSLNGSWYNLQSSSQNSYAVGFGQPTFTGAAGGTAPTIGSPPVLTWMLVPVVCFLVYVGGIVAIVMLRLRLTRGPRPALGTHPLSK